MLAFALCAPAATLPVLNLDLKQTSVSGISSGGYMAVQFAVAHSEIVSGIGVFAGGPYRCAADGVAQALGPCMQGAPDTARSSRLLARLAAVRCALRCVASIITVSVAVLSTASSANIRSNTPARDQRTKRL